MAETAAFDEKIASTAARILEETAKGELTSWDLKVRLHLPGSLLYMSLGWLAEQGKIRIYPDELTYKIRYAVPTTKQVPEKSHSAG